MVSACPGASTAGVTTTNSSPPRRATLSPARSAADSRRATSDGLAGHAHPERLAVAPLLDQLVAEGLAAAQRFVDLGARALVRLVGEEHHARGLAVELAAAPAVHLFEAPVAALEQAVADEGDADHAVDAARHVRASGPPRCA